MGRCMRKVLLAIAVLAVTSCGNEPTADTNAAEPAVPLAPSAVGDTAVPVVPPPAEPPATDLIPSNE